MVGMYLEAMLVPFVLDLRRSLSRTVKKELVKRKASLLMFKVWVI